MTNITTPQAASPGAESGNTARTKAPKRVQPSTRAASSSSGDSDNEAVQERRRKPLDGFRKVRHLLEDRPLVAAARDDEREVGQRKLARDQRPDVLLQRLFRLQATEHDGHERQHEERDREEVS